MGEILMGKSVAKRAFGRAFTEDPLACLLEWILGDAFELEKGTRWFDLLLEVEIAEKEGEIKGGIDLMLETMLRGIASGMITLDGEVLRIHEEKYQEAMDVAGVWYDPFKPPEGEDVYRASQNLSELVKEVGFEKAVDIVTKMVQGGSNEP